MKYFYSRAELIKLRRGTGKGWRAESQRHALAAKGVRTSGKSETELEIIRMRLTEKQRLEKEVALEAKVHLKQMRLFLKYIRKRKGKGSAISPGDFEHHASEARKISAKLGGRYDNYIDRLEKQYRFYEKTDFVPRKPLKLDKTKKKKYLAAKITVEKPEPGRTYPVTPEDIRDFEKKDKNAEYLKEVRFTNPKDDQQKNAYAQYVRRDRRINVFSQPAVKAQGNTYFVERTELIPMKQMRHVVKTKVLPHEASHHKILYRDRITDKSQKVAEARAEALRRGEDYKNRNVVSKYVGSSVVG